MKRDDRDRERAAQTISTIRTRLGVRPSEPNIGAIVALINEVRAEAYEEVAEMAEKNYGALSSTVLKRKAARLRRKR